MNQLKLKDLDAFFDVLRSVYSMLKMPEGDFDLAVQSLASISKKGPPEFVFLSIPLLRSISLPDERNEEILSLIDKAISESSQQMVDSMSGNDARSFIEMMTDAHAGTRSAKCAVEFQAAMHSFIDKVEPLKTAQIIELQPKNALTLILSEIISERLPQRKSVYFVECFREVVEAASSKGDEIVAICTSLCQMSNLYSSGLILMSQSLKLSCDIATQKARNWLSQAELQIFFDLIFRGFCSGASLISAVTAANLLIESEKTISSHFSEVRISSKLFLNDTINCVLGKMHSQSEIGMKLWHSFLQFIYPEVELKNELQMKQKKRFLARGLELDTRISRKIIESIEISPRKVSLMADSFIVSQNQLFESQGREIFRGFLKLLESKQKPEMNKAILASIHEIVQSVALEKKMFKQIFLYVSQCEDTAGKILDAQKDLIVEMGLNEIIPAKMRFKILCKLICRPNLREIRGLICNVTRRVIPKDSFEPPSVLLPLMAFLLIQIGNEQNEGMASSLAILYTLAKSGSNQSAIDEIKECHSLQSVLKCLHSAFLPQNILESIDGVYITLFGSKEYSTADLIEAADVFIQTTPFQTQSFILNMLLSIIHSRMGSEESLIPSTVKFITSISAKYPAITITGAKQAGVHMKRLSLFYQIAKIIIDENMESGNALFIKNEIVPVLIENLEHTSYESTEFLNAMMACLSLANMLIKHPNELSISMTSQDGIRIKVRLISGFDALLGQLEHGHSPLLCDLIEKSLLTLGTWLRLPPPINAVDFSAIVSIVKSPLIDFIIDSDGIKSLAIGTASNLSKYDTLFRLLISLLEITLNGTETSIKRALLFSIYCSEATDEIAHFSHHFDPSLMSIILKLSSFTLPLSLSEEMKAIALRFLSWISHMMNNAQKGAAIDDFNAFISGLSSPQVTELINILIANLNGNYAKLPHESSLLCVEKSIQFVSPMFGDSEISMFSKLIGLTVNTQKWPQNLKSHIDESIRLLIHKSFDATVPLIIASSKEVAIQELFLRLCNDDSLTGLLFGYIFSVIGGSSSLYLTECANIIAMRSMRDKGFQTWSEQEISTISRSIMRGIWKLLQDFQKDVSSLQKAVALLERYIRNFNTDLIETYFVWGPSVTAVQVFDYLSSLLSVLPPPLFLALTESLFTDISKMNPLSQLFCHEFLSLIIFKFTSIWCVRPIKELAIACTNFCVVTINLIRDDVDIVPVIHGLRRAFSASPIFSDLIPFELGRDLFTDLTKKFREDLTADFIFCMKVLIPCVEPGDCERINENLHNIFVIALMNPNTSLICVQTFNTLVRLDHYLSAGFVLNSRIFLALIKLALSTSSEVAKASRLFIRGCFSQTPECPEGGSDFVIWCIKSAIKGQPSFQLADLIENVFAALSYAPNDDALKLILSSILQNVPTFGLSAGECKTIRESIVDRIKSSVKWEKDISIRSISLLI